VRLLAALAVTALLTGCGVTVDEQPRALDPDDAPFGVITTASPDEPDGEGRVALYFVRGDKVVLQTRPVEESVDVDELVDLLLDGPTPQQVAEGTRTELPATFAVEDVDVGSNGIAVVELADDSAPVTASPLAFAQVVATLTAPGRARAVRFRLDGEDLQVPRGDGSLTFEPLDRSDYADLLALSGPPSPAPSPAPD
jgi:spore germination protein GerM